MHSWLQRPAVRRLLVGAGALAVLLGFARCARAEPFPPPSDGTVTVGPFAVVCKADPAAAQVVCLAHLAAVVVAAHTLTAAEPGFDFDVAAGNATAKGHLAAFFLPPDQLSTVQADLVVTPAGQEPQVYRGAFAYWQAGESKSPDTAKQPRRRPARSRSAVAVRKAP